MSYIQNLKYVLIKIVSPKVMLYRISNTRCTKFARPYVIFS